MGNNRGWVYAGNISSIYEDQPAPVISIGAAVGIGIIAFSVGSSWDSHCRSRPWYRQRQHWVHRPPPAHRPGHAKPVPMPMQSR